MIIDKIKYGLFAIALVAVVFAGAITDSAKTKSNLLPSESGLNQRSTFYPLKYEPVRDSVYVLSSNYIEIDLSKQLAYLISRQHDTIIYKISSGNAFISQGIETTTGIFTVQSKSEKAISKQFNDAELFYWIGFNGNIGFHGLKGNGYYGYLGKRPSSHGCVRISREDGKDIYKRVKRGTPVLVHKGNPARVFTFADSSLLVSNSAVLLSSLNSFDRKNIDRRLDNLYNGKAHILNNRQLILDGTSVIRGYRISVGESEKIAATQEIPIHTFKPTVATKDRIADQFRMKYHKPKSYN